MFASVSLIAVGAFILTLAVVVYEVIMLRKKKSTTQQPQEQTVNLPDYQQDPKAVQSMTTVPNVANAQIPQEVSAEAPMQARELPSRGKFFALAAAFIVVIVLIGGAFFLNSRRTEKKITQANVESTPKPTKAQIVAEPTTKPTKPLASTPTPTTVITIVVETDDVSVTPNQDQSSQEKGSTGSSIIKPTSSMTITPTEKMSSGSASISPTKATEMPKSGIINQTVILAGISVLFIALAFIL